MAAFTMTIEGESVAATESFEVTDPATGEAFAEAPSCPRADLDRAMRAAERAFATWKNDEAARRSALVRAAQAIAEGAEPLARLLSQEQGKPLRFAKREVLGAAATFAAHADLPIPVDVTRRDEQGRIEIHRRPLGVTAAITPWNFPVLIAAAKLAPALLAGNTVVLKPSPYTPLSTLKLAELLNAVLPAGVANVVSGGDDLGRQIVEHPAVRKVSFTGSVATGEKVAASAAAGLKRVTLELGGNDAAIVLGDVDPDKIALDLFWGAFLNSGQVCTAIKRMYVHESIFSPVVDAISAIARRVKVGPGLEPQVDLGPINNAPQFERVKELFADAKARGATVHAGGGPRSRPGYFFDPTIVTGLEDDARVVAEEQFGPVLPVLPFKEIDEAIARANDTPFGLSGSVWTSDPEQGARIASRLDCGTAWVNQHIALSNLAPFGGAKSSGIGYESGRWGLDAFCQLHVLNVRA
jgi:acyl-CoA reductase-like NAD-dependent aldehyde dehydrogenase